MSKRGQVTVFIILGIVVIAVIAFFLYLGGIFTKEEMTREEAERFVATQIEPIKNIVRDCVKKDLVEGVLFVSIQGGYFDPIYYETFGGYDIAYACKENVNLLPLLSFIAGEIVQYQDSNIEETYACIESGFDKVEDRGLDLTYDFSNLVLSNPIITSDKITQEVRFPFTVEKSGYTASVNEVMFEVKSNLAGVYGVAVDVVNAECGGAGFEVDDYVWEHNQALDIIPAFISNGPNQYGYYPWYLTSVGMEENGEVLKFHFCIE